MVRKIFTYIGIILGCALLFCVGTVVILFLAPGTELFGIRYVAPGQGVYQLSEDKEFMKDFTGDIYIESNEIPIEISFSLIHNVQVEYKQDFVGLTRTENKMPVLEYKVENGDLYLKSKDLVKFIYAREIIGGDLAHFKVYIPYTFTGRSINVNSENSIVKVNAGGSSLLDTLKVNTNSNIDVVGTLNAAVVDFSSRQAIEINDNINASHYKLNAGTNNIKVNRDILGTLEVDASSANLYMKNANKLIFKSTSGAIKPVGETPITLNSAEIITHSGSINIGSFTGNDESKIETTSGTVNIDRVNNVNITNARGPINIGKIGKAVINGGIGEVNVNEVTLSINVTTRNGKVSLGAEELKVNNPTVNTTTGKIIVRNACGKVDLTSNQNEIDVVGDLINSIKINAGDRVKAYKLSGDIDITANGEIDMQIESLTGSVTVNAKDGCKKVMLDVKNYILNAFNYNFKSTKARLVTIQEGDKVTNEGKSAVKREPSIAGLFDVVITTTYADIFVYTK